MAYKVAINALKGGSDSGIINNGIAEKDINLAISKYISNRLSELNIENFLVRDNDEFVSTEERVNIIKNKYGSGNNVIIISNGLNEENLNGTQILYPLRNNSRLASTIANNLENAGQNVIKYYQQRDNYDTSLDRDDFTRQTANNQAITINYGYTNTNNDINKINENYEILGEAVVKAIANYAGVPYSPIYQEGYYIVKKGDSLWSIAGKNNTTVDNLKKLNNLSSNSLSIGQLIKLPGTNVENDMNGNTYIVQKGDSLWVIANKFNTTVDNLKNINNLSSNLLSFGQILVIPQNDISNNTTYTVQKGDSLWSIANKFNTTVDNLKNTNNLSSNLLSIGQVLVIPQNNISNSLTYTVQKGDSLWSIARKFNTTVDSIKKKNNLSSNLLSIGQTLIL